MVRGKLDLRVAAELWLFLPPRRRHADLRLPYDGTSSLGHVVESAGIPLPEIGSLLTGGRPITPSYRPSTADVVHVCGMPRPQRIPAPRFVLDVHLGTLARRLRLVGVDVAYRNDLDDDALIIQANAERRVLLTKDRRLLFRRSLWLGAYVRGARPDDQFRDTLDRFAPPLAPWTRCTACNGLLSPVAKAEIEEVLPPGTRRSYDTFARCPDCGHVYWRGAHGNRLEAIVESASRLAGTTNVGHV
ncbi:hypothetical protein Psi02_12880 [Planotetraspora silvatica]|uniref:Twitching motility protein PilT n=1 Tax=Planotetraspora silvatica TaxID=234614 RepID=A0A8J3UM97_9ACTN|nr:Mut7-C RNAse domain-containing protein [Planotetraspora silvatica]GII44864.1 hypothetical protein Psi02_12880 [Planotetraspora silvatica]